MATEPRSYERPLRADARRNRERILEAARSECAAHGAAVQIDDVARRAGVGVGTVDRHFPTKDALIEALVAEKIRVTTENLREALEIADPWEAFAAGVRRNAEVNDAAERLVTRAQEAGELRDDVTVEDVGALIGGLCASMAHPELDWRRHLEVLLDGLRARG